MEITKKEIQLFREIALNNPETVSKLSQTTSTPLSYTSTILKKMQKKGLITQHSNGKEKHPHIAYTPHASILRSFILDRPHINLDILANKGIPILATITCQNLRTTDEFLEASGVSYRTLWGFMNKARGMGVIHKNETFTISPRHEYIAKFIEAYQGYIHQIKAKEHSVDALVKWGCRDNFIFETKDILDLQRTGISAFQDYGALFFTLRNLYSSVKYKLRLEDHIINHILSERKQNTVPLLIIWRLNWNNLDTEYINKKAYRLKAFEITNAIQRYMQSKGKEKPDYLLNWREFTEKYGDYSDE